MSMAIGIVEQTTKRDHGALFIAPTQTSESPERVITKINKIANAATIPIVPLSSFVAIVARLCPLWRNEAKSTTKS